MEAVVHSILAEPRRGSAMTSGGGAERGAWSTGGADGAGAAALALYTTAAPPRAPTGCGSPRCAAYAGAGALVVGGGAGYAACQAPMTFAADEPVQIKAVGRPVWKQPSRKNIEG
jgi:hypothetical protein